MMPNKREKSETISARIPISVIKILNEEVINKLRLGDSLGESVKNIVLKWLFDNNLIDEKLVPAIMLYFDKTKIKNYLSYDELINQVEEMKPGETLEGIAIKK